MPWAKQDSDTLGGTASEINSTVNGVDFNMTMAHIIDSGATNIDLEFNNDSGSNYASRYSFNGATDSTETSQAMIHGNGFTTRENFDIAYIIGIDTEEKLVIRFTVDRETAGAGGAPSRLEGIGKWANTSDSITEITLEDNLGLGGTYSANSNLSSLGSDLTPASATSIETGSIYIDTDIAGRYFYDGTNWNMQPTLEETFGSKTGWTEKDATECNIDTGNNRIHYNGDLDLTDSTVYYDVVGQLGKAFNGEKLIFRCEPKKITSANLSHRIEFRIADNFGAIADSSNAVGFYLGANNSFGGFVNENSATRTDATAFSNVSNGVAKYLEIVIDGKTVYFRTYTDNTYSIISQERTLTMTNYLPDLTYIKLGDRVTNSTTNTLEMELKNLNVWSGVTSIN